MPFPRFATTFACLAVAAHSLLLAGCYRYQLTNPTTPPVSAFGETPENGAQICVYRPGVLAGAVTFVVRDNGKLVGATRGASYFCYVAEVGDHELTAEADETAHAKITAQAGARYHLEQVPVNLFGYVKTELNWVDEPTARTLVSQCDYEVLSGVPGEETLPQAVPFAPARAATR